MIFPTSIPTQRTRSEENYAHKILSDRIAGVGGPRRARPTDRPHRALPRQRHRRHPRQDALHHPDCTAVVGEDSGSRHWRQRLLDTGFRAELLLPPSGKGRHPLQSQPDHRQGQRLLVHARRCRNGGPRFKSHDRAIGSIDTRQRARPGEVCARVRSGCRTDSGAGWPSASIAC